jgi:pimeloyl-ACP methyl ester carboxylesterase
MSTPLLPLPLPRRTLLGAATLGPLLAAAGCTNWQVPAVPLPVQRIAARCGGREAAARCILLPGIASLAEDFIPEGFVAELQRQAPCCDVLLAEAHLGYFTAGQLLQRLRADVVLARSVGSMSPARPKPWLVGISLGGFAALAYAMQHGSDIAGVLAVAPYLGRRELLRDISAAGGPAAWARLPLPATPPREPQQQLEDALWRWLGAPPKLGGAASGGVPIYLGFGRSDRFIDAQRVLQTLLPADHTDVVDGPHDWPPWRLLWRRWLQRGLLTGA